MGYTQILEVACERIELGATDRQSLARILGEAVLQGCSGDAESGGTLQPDDLIRCSDVVHSSSLGGYLFSHNRLKRLDGLDDRELQVLASLIIREQERRAGEAPPAEEPGASPPSTPLPTGITCSGCHAYLPWDGSTSTVTCDRCRKIVPARNLAVRLMTSFCAAVADYDPPFTFAAQLVMHFAQCGWGTGLHLGRGDWMALGLPLADAELAELLARGDTNTLHDLSRFFQVLSSNLAREADLPLTEAALITRIEQATALARNADAEVYPRECLYRIASAPMFKNPELVELLTAALAVEAAHKVLTRVIRKTLEAKAAGVPVGAAMA